MMSRGFSTSRIVGASLAALAALLIGLIVLTGRPALAGSVAEDGSPADRPTVSQPPARPDQNPRPSLPDGPARPDQPAEADRRAAAPRDGWFAFAPAEDPFRSSSGVNLRSLNEETAGAGGFIGVKGSRFIHTTTGEPVRFWGVNAAPSRDPDALRREARVLAKRGVNLVRVRPILYNPEGVLDPEAVLQAARVVAAMKAEGIYTLFSIYSPYRLTTATGASGIQDVGKDGAKHPFAELMFDRESQSRYEAWWNALLSTPNPTTSERLADDPAVAAVEIQNDDSFFFGTFDSRNLPEAERRALETQFGDWLKDRYGTLQVAVDRWGRGVTVESDRPQEGRMGLRALGTLVSQKTLRDKDTARFLAETQRDFYKRTFRFLRLLGFQGVISASNRSTSSPEDLELIETYTHAVTDAIDHPGAFGCGLQGILAPWALEAGATFADRSALRFDPEKPGKPRRVVHPAAIPAYDRKPAIVSEIAWDRPNRYRSEAPLSLAAFGASHGTAALVHSEFDGAGWSVRSGPPARPWSLMSPAMMGQFPAAALIFRKRLVAEGDLLVALAARPEELFDLKGTPLPQDAALDGPAPQTMSQGALPFRPGTVVDPLVLFAGRASLRFNDRARPPVVKDFRRWVDRTRQTVVSGNGQLRLDYGKGLLTIDAPAAQGVSGALGAVGGFDLGDLTIHSSMELGHVVAVSLDDQPLATSKKILLQVMTEEKPTDFQTEPTGDGGLRVVRVGRDPWLVRRAEGVVRFKRGDAARLEVKALDPNGDPVKPFGTAAEIRLDPTTLYYLIETPPPAPRRPGQRPPR